jgi:hypothetical protein
MNTKQRPLPAISLGGIITNGFTSFSLSLFSSPAIVKKEASNRQFTVHPCAHVTSLWARKTETTFT